MKVALLAGLVLVAASAASAQDVPSEMLSPTISMSKVDWDAAAASVPGKSEEPAREVFVRLNAATSGQFPGIADSTVPVLLPLDIAATLKDKDAGKAPNEVLAGGFRASKFFLPGPAGYDATFFIKSSEVPGLGVRYPRPIEVEIAGAAFFYELEAPSVVESKETPHAIETEFPGMRRILREGRMRYAFTRFGVPYVVSIDCFDGRVSGRRLACADVDQVAVRFLRTLQVAGGTPQPPRKPPSIDLTRPQVVSLSFTYHSSGSLIPNSGYKLASGRPDNHVYARIRFPLAEAPAYAKSQSFMPWGDCYMKGKIGRTNYKGAPYRCRLNDKQLVFDESAPENFSYPWRDNFCETRDLRVGQCPAGIGHQGQDIRTSTCVLRNEGADRCQPYQHDIAAVRDGMIWRNSVQDFVYEAVYLVINTANDRVRFRYLHLDPKRMDADGLESGRRVAQGEIIGKVGNYNKKENGTSYHLHFDVQVWTRDGWVWVNPYMTLVSAYERLIGARGTEIKDGEPEPAAVPGIPPQVGALLPAPALTTAPAPAVQQTVATKPKPARRYGRRKSRSDDETN
ncbi:MAG: peptidoglycan DD-metalloendopeptidase family protein [Hyphomicrobiales bacterium]